MENGSVVKFLTTSSNISVSGGHLETLPAAGSRATTWFTGLSDDSVGGDTNGDGPSNGVPGSNYGIFLQNGSTGTFRETFFAYGGASGYAGVTTTSGYATLIDWDGGGLLGHLGDGMRVNATTLDLRNLEINGNGSDGFELNTTVPAVLHNLSINNNGGYAGRINQNPGNLDGTLSGFGSFRNGIYVSGNLGGAEPSQRWVWDSADSMPIIINTVTAAEGDTLELAPGMVAKFNANSSSLTCSAGSVLEAPGGEDIWFTSIADDAHGGDTNNDGNATTPLPGQGYGIFLQNDSRAFLNDFWVAYGGASGYAGVTTTSGYPEVITWDGGGIMGCLYDGANVNADVLDLRNVMLVDNGQDGFEMNPTNPPVFDNIVASGNGVYGLKVNQNPGNLPDTFSGSANGLNGIYVSGNLGGNGASGSFSWASGDGFPIIVGSVTVATGDTMTVQPGTIMKSAFNSASLTVSGGTLRSLAGEASWYTSIADDAHGGDTNNDGDMSAPTGGQGYGLFLQNDSTVELNDFWIGYQGASGYAGATTTSGYPDLITWNGGGIIGCLYDGARVNADVLELRNLLLENNGQDGFEMNPINPPVLDNIVANGNAGYGLRVNQNPGNLQGNITGSGNDVNGIFLTGTVGGSAGGSFSWATGYAFPVILGSVTVAAGDSLTCQPGTVVKYGFPSASLSVPGTLLAPGGYPVWFTSLKDDLRGGDTNNDGNATSPTPGDGYGIFLNGSSHVDVNDFWIAYGGHAGYSNIHSSSGTVPTFRWNRGGCVLSLYDGIRVSAADLDFTRLRIVDNGGDGLEIANQGTADVHGCDISGNGVGGIRNTTGTTVAAPGNWWGHDSGPLDVSEDNPDYNPGGQGDEAIGWVSYLDYLVEPPINAAPTAFLALSPDGGSVFNSGPITFTWTESMDPDNDGIYYNLEVSRNAEFTDVYIYKGDIPGLSVTIDASELEPEHTSWWRVIARDGMFGETIADPGLRAIIHGDPSLSPVEDQTRFSFTVGRTWPNPSSHGSRLAFSLPAAEQVRVDVYDIRGRLVRTVTDQIFEAGEHSLQWDGRDRSGQPSADGLYFYRLQAESGQRIRKVMIVR